MSPPKTSWAHNCTRLRSLVYTIVYVIIWVIYVVPVHTWLSLRKFGDELDDRDPASTSSVASAAEGCRRRDNFSRLRDRVWEFNCAGFYFALMMWLMVYSSACSSVLQVISGDIDGIIHRYSCCAEFGCWFLSFYVSCGIKCLRFSQRAVYNYNRYYSIHIFTETKKSSLSMRDCRTRLARRNSQARTRTEKYSFSLFS